MTVFGGKGVDISVFLEPDHNNGNNSTVSATPNCAGTLWFQKGGVGWPALLLTKKDNASEEWYTRCPRLLLRTEGKNPFTTGILIDRIVFYTYAEKFCVDEYWQDSQENVYLLHHARHHLFFTHASPFVLFVDFA